MKRGHVVLVGALIIVVAVILISTRTRASKGAQESATPVAVMSVALTHAVSSILPARVPATGDVAAWQEAIIGTEADGLRLTEVKVNVGDTVSSGQVLALLHGDIIEAELAEARAAVVQAKAEAREADTNLQRARNLGGAGVMSAQEAGRYAAAAETARARLDAMQAVEQRSRLRLAQTRVLAPSDGIITVRTATVGAVAASGQELFRLIKDGRLEWRAVVSVADLEKLEPEQIAWITAPDRAPIQGKLRMVGPVIDTETRSGLVFVDLPRDSPVRAGEFVRGHFETGDGPALTLPQTAVLMRDGFNYVMRVGSDSTVILQKVSIGRRMEDRVEITAGLSDSEQVIASGLNFLNAGDTVRVVDSLAKHAGNQLPTSGAMVLDSEVPAGNEP